MWGRVGGGGSERLGGLEFCVDALEVSWDLPCFYLPVKDAWAVGFRGPLEVNAAS